MGQNNSGQLGNGTTIGTNRPITVTSNVVAVAAGIIHSLFVKSDGSLWGMGHNGDGELGNGNNTNQLSPVQVPGLTVASLGASDQAVHSLAVAVQSLFLSPLSVSTTNRQQVRLQFSGLANYPYTLQATTNLMPPVSWQPVVTNAAGTNGIWQFLDINVTVPQKFYRAVGQ